MIVNQGFFIELQDTARSFFPGQTIVGRVVIQNTKPRDLKYVSIIFGGRANVHWTETHTYTTGTGKNRTTRTRTVHYSASEDYFSCKIMLFGNESGNEITLPTGVTFYPFQFTLPLNLPSSYAGGYGSVHYLMEARMKRVWHKADIVSKVPFTVNGILDLNTEQGVNQPVEYQKQKTVCCCCCKSGPVGYKIKLPCLGFVPGQFAEFSGEFTNMSRRKINHVKLSLLQYVTFHANSKSRTTVQELGKAFSSPILKGDSEYWGGHVLKIPPVPPTRLGNCRIIDVQYKLKFEMDIKGLTVNLKAEIPITIGTIPFVNSFGELMPHQNSPNNGIAQELFAPTAGFSGDAYSNQPAPTAPVFDMYPNLPPPTYAEAMQIDMSTFDKVEPEETTEGGDEGKSNAAFSPDNSTLNEKNENEIYDTQQATNPAVPFVPNYITYGFISPPRQS